MDKVTDPVCGMEIDPASAAGKSVHQSQEYFFCSLGCKRTFDADPGRYASAASGHGAHDHH